MEVYSEEICEQLEREYNEAREEFLRIADLEAEKKAELLRKEVSEMSESDQETIAQYDRIEEKKPVMKGGLVFFLIVLLLAGTIILFSTVLKDFGKDMPWVKYASMAVAFLFPIILASCLNAKARNSRKQIKKLEETPAVKKYIAAYKRIKNWSSEEYRNAKQKSTNANNVYWKYLYSNTIIIIGSASRCEDTFSLHKRVSLYINGSEYYYAMKPGKHEIDVDPGNYSISFREHESPRNKDGLLSAAREGYYGGADTVSEFSCNVRVGVNSPALIVMKGKKEYIVKENVSLPEAEKYV